MEYDALNRMTSWSDGLRSESMTYRGAEWHRASVTANGETTAFLYDGDNVLIDYVSGSGGASDFERLYVTPFLDQNLSMTDSRSGETFYYSRVPPVLEPGRGAQETER
jgi:hypothetical protein